MKISSLLIVFLSIIFGLFLRWFFPLIPDGRNELIILVCLAVMTGVTVNSLIKRRSIVSGIHTYLRPDTLFYLFFYILFAFPYLSDFFGYSDIHQNKFIAQLFIEHINRAVVSATVAIIFFGWGYGIFEKSKYLQKEQQANDVYWLDYRVAKTARFISVLLFFILFGILVVTGTLGQLFREYTGLGVGDNTSDGILYLMTHFSMLMISLTISIRVVENRAEIRDWIYILPPLVWSILLLVSGDRNSFLLIVLVFIVGYSTYFYRVSILTLVIGGVFAFGVYQAIEITRSIGEKSFSDVISTIGNKSNDSENGLAESSFSLTTITLRASFHDNPDGDMLHYGKFKLVGILGVIPYSRGLFFDKNRENVTSAEYITDTVLGKESDWSIGSNLISDVVVDVGVIFLPLFMLIIGATGGFVFCLAKETLHK